MNALPKAYNTRPGELGPRTRRYMEAQGWLDRRRVVQRTWAHKDWCNERCSAPVCTCQTKDKP